MSEAKICPTCGTEYPLSERFCPRDGTALRNSNPQGDLVGSVVHEKFHVIKKLGEGGMGSVYLAEHVKMGRKVALKVMNPGMHQDPDAIARFNREAKNASQLNHPNICAIYDFGETPDGLIYLAMEFIEGSSLTSVIEKSDGLTPPRAASIIHQAADALQVAHDYGIVHRDLKPDNIMIARARDGSDVAKVVDFGIAKASSSDAQKVTKTGLVVGTPEYMSPEQLAGDKLDGRSDIYSLGLVAFNCLTGKLPFPSNSAQEAMIMRLTDQPKTLAEMRPEVTWSDELQGVMDRALARDAADRYQSAAEFGRDISHAVENLPQTLVAEAGTQVIGAGAVAAAAGTRTAAAAAPAVPKTRVAGPAERGRTAAPPAPAASVAAAPSARRAMPVVAIVAAAVIVGGGGLLAVKTGMLGGARKDSLSVATDPVQSAAANTSADAGGQQAGNPAANTGNAAESGAGSATRPAPSTKQPTAPAPGGGGNTPSPRVNATNELQRIADLVKGMDAGEANTALGAISTLLPALTNRADSVEALYHRAEAYAVIDGDGGRACPVLKSIAGDEARKKGVASLRQALSCP
ncbi:MAG: protein kinase [Gemmatimonadaceae bacterium]|nr:protein kinase [Gemmatimonadaceae bacterium]